MSVWFLYRSFLSSSIFLLQFFLSEKFWSLHGKWCLTVVLACISLMINELKIDPPGLGVPLAFIHSFVPSFIPLAHGPQVPVHQALCWGLSV